jgi:hypothetical protein
MKPIKKTFALLALLTFVTTAPTFAQDSMRTSSQNLFRFATAQEIMQNLQLKARAKEIIQDSEYDRTGFEVGIFLDNSLMLDGRPLNYGSFGLQSSGELTVARVEAATGQRTMIPFFVYLRRNGTKLFVPGKERPDVQQLTIDLREVLEHAKPGDQLIIEPVKKEDGPTKRILKLISNGC